MKKKQISLIVLTAFIFFLVGGLVTANLEAASSLAQRLAGRILLQVESKGEAWYVDPVSLQRYYLGRAQDCFDIMREKGLGITNNNLYSINIAASSKAPGYTLGWKDYTGELAIAFKYPNTLVKAVEDPHSMTCRTSQNCTWMVGFSADASQGAGKFYPNLSVYESQVPLTLSLNVDYEYLLSKSNQIFITYKINEHSNAESDFVHYEAITPSKAGDYYYKFSMWYRKGDDTTVGANGENVFEEILTSALFK